MALRRISFLLLTVCALGLLFLSCQKQSNVGSTNPQMTSRTWPPDTMAVTALGSGRLAIKASWKPRNSGVGVASSSAFEVAGIFTPPDTTPGMHLGHIPDTTAAMLKQIIDQPRPAPSGNALLLVKWPPDTTGN